MASWRVQIRRSEYHHAVGCTVCARVVSIGSPTPPRAAGVISSAFFPLRSRRHVGGMCANMFVRPPTRRPRCSRASSSPSPSARRSRMGRWSYWGSWRSWKGGDVGRGTTGRAGEQARAAGRRHPNRPACRVCLNSEHPVRRPCRARVWRRAWCDRVRARRGADDGTRRMAHDRLRSHGRVLQAAEAEAQAEAEESSTMARMAASRVSPDAPASFPDAGGAWGGTLLGSSLIRCLAISSPCPRVTRRCLRRGCTTPSLPGSGLRACIHLSSTICPNCPIQRVPCQTVQLQGQLFNLPPALILDHFLLLASLFTTTSTTTTQSARGTCTLPHHHFPGSHSLRAPQYSFQPSAWYTSSPRPSRSSAVPSEHDLRQRTRRAEQRRRRGAKGHLATPRRLV